MKKKKKPINPATSKFTVLRQVCNLIPAHLVPKIAREHDSEIHARTFSHWSHVVSLLHAQLSHSLGLNDVCDALQLHSGPLSLRFGAPRHPAATAFHMPTRRARLKWQRVFSGK
jgi:hypothetical protein